MRVGGGEERVEGPPGRAGVNHGVESRAGSGEQGYGLRETVDGGPPLLTQQEEDGGDQGPRVADADPPDEVDDVEAPAHRHVGAPDADPLEEQEPDRDEQELQEGESGREAQPPPQGRPALKNDGADLA